MGAVRPACATASAACWRSGCTACAAAGKTSRTTTHCGATWRCRRRWAAPRSWLRRPRSAGWRARPRWSTLRRCTACCWSSSSPVARRCPTNSCWTSTPRICRCTAAQEGAHFHAHYDSYCYLPLRVLRAGDPGVRAAPELARPGQRMQRLDQAHCAAAAPSLARRASDGASGLGLFPPEGAAPL